MNMNSVIYDILGTYDAGMRFCLILAFIILIISSCKWYKYLVRDGFDGLMLFMLMFADFFVGVFFYVALSFGCGRYPLDCRDPYIYNNTSSEIWGRVLIGIALLYGQSISLAYLFRLRICPNIKIFLAALFGILFSYKCTIAGNYPVFIKFIILETVILIVYGIYIIIHFVTKRPPM